MRASAWIGLLCLALAPAACVQTLDLPRRPADAPGGSEVARRIEGLALEEREEVVLAEVARGNVPAAFRRLRRVDVRRVVDGRAADVSFWVAADYLAVGRDGDALYLPLTPQAAQRVADLAGAVLPTPLLVDVVWAAADVRLEPEPIPPSPEMTTVPVFRDHDRRVRAQRARRGGPAGALVAGHKKDVVLTRRLGERPGRVAIYGWHRPDGRPIQPLYLGHTDRWVDYSHGVRLVARTVVIDGVRHDVADVLRDPRRAPLLSDEGAIPVPRYE